MLSKEASQDRLDSRVGGSEKVEVSTGTEDTRVTNGKPISKSLGNVIHAKQGARKPKELEIMEVESEKEGTMTLEVEGKPVEVRGGAEFLIQFLNRT